MSWSFSVAATPKDQFDAAVDAAQPTGQPLETPGLSEDVAAAKLALKELARRVKRDNVGGSASGHCLNKGAGEGDQYHDGISVNVYGPSKQ